MPLALLYEKFPQPNSQRLSVDAQRSSARSSHCVQRNSIALLERAWSRLAGIFWKCKSSGLLLSHYECIIQGRPKIDGGCRHLSWPWKCHPNCVLIELCRVSGSPSEPLNRTTCYLGWPPHCLSSCSITPALGISCLISESFYRSKVML